MRAATSCLIAIGLLAATHAAGQYRESPVTHGGTISGEIRVVGELPRLPSQPVFKHQEFCGTSMPDQRLVAGKEGELKNAVVYLTDIREGKAAQLKTPVKLDNIACAFVPHVFSATRGQSLEIHNSDPLLHDAHATIGSHTLFNVAIIKGNTVTKLLPDAGLIHINCNVRHTWMQAYGMVVEHPYHAVTTSDGRFQLDDVPPGVWNLRVWHELLGSTDQQVRVQGGQDTRVKINLQTVAGGGAADVP
jgi:hypothetical protein